MNDTTFLTDPAETDGPDLAPMAPQLFSSMLEQSEDCVKLIGPEGTLDFMSANGCRAMEIDNFALLRGLLWTELWPEESRQAISDALARAALGPLVQLEAFCPTAKGRPRWWRVRISPLFDDAKCLAGYISVSRDISAERHSTNDPSKAN